MVLNAIIIVVICALLFLALFIYIKKTRNLPFEFEIEENKYDWQQITAFVKDKFNEILKTNLHALNLTKEEFDKRLKNRQGLRKALKSCSYGDVQAKEYVKMYIRDILLSHYNINETNISNIIDFSSVRNLTAQDLFEMLLVQYKSKHGQNALEKLIVENQLDILKTLDDTQGYVITAEDIERVYNERAEHVTFEDHLEMVVQRIYQSYKGYGVIDEIRDMRIDGVSGGVSGVPLAFYENNDRSSLQSIPDIPYNYDSVWLFFKGKTIHLSFLSFGSEKELIRVCKNIYRYNNPGQLSENNGYKVNEMKDGSRVVVARPPFSESWVFFVRKFDSIKRASIQELITDDNNEIVIELIKWLIKGNRVTAITGSQGTGKTTLLMSIIQFINPTYTLRIQEMSFELQLRKIYPYRNIVTFRETATISGQEGLNLQKKTDGVVNILGEVAEAGLSTLMIQMAQVASLFTIFTHHAKTAENLVLSIRNNLLQTGVFHNENIALQQVVDVINFDIHLGKSVDGHRYIERITEIIPSTIYSPYPHDYKDKKNLSQKEEAFLENMQTFFERMTDRKVFETRDIIRFENGRYRIVGSLSSHSINEISKNLDTEELALFENFVRYRAGGDLSE